MWKMVICIFSLWKPIFLIICDFKTKLPFQLFIDTWKTRNSVKQKNPTTNEDFMIKLVIGLKIGKTF